jgi:hypothetical protein
MAATEKSTLASKQQTEMWLQQAIVAWDDDDKLSVKADVCKLYVKTKRKSTIMNFEGILFPIEVIAKGNSHNPYVRIRFKNRYSGDYGMERECNVDNDYCRKNIGKWSPVSYYDFNITHVTQYRGRDEDLNIDKSGQLKNALQHYAKLCNATDYNFHF